MLVPATGEWLESVTYYDALGRVIQTVSRNHVGGTDRTSSLYDFSGHVLKSVTTHTSEYGIDHTIVERFDYDHAGRLLRVRYRMDTLKEVILSENIYDELGRVMKKKLYGTGDGAFAQEVDYHYNVRGWLKSINDPDSLGSDLFAESLGYEDPGGYAADSLFSGNISVMRWRTPSLGGSVAYAFGYDGLGRLVRASWYAPEDQGEDYSVPLIAYDLNGNIDTLVRWGRAPEAGGIIDALGYSYNGNRLIAVDDATEEKTVTPGFSDHGSKYDKHAAGRDTLPEYRYDANGNMVSDANKGILAIRYDHNNLPAEILFDHDRRIRYLYDANGTKLRKEVYGNGGHLLSVTDYDGNFIYRDGEPAYILTGEGRLVYDDESRGWQWEYFLKDHLGNTRVTFRTDSSGRAVAVQENHYYPFGMSIATLDRSSLSEDPDQQNKYLYNGKEYQNENGLEWYDYGARYYDAKNCRFISADPKTEKYIFQTVYSYAVNNPIKFIDINGEGVPPLDDVFYQRELIRRTGNKKKLEEFDKGMKKAFRGGGKALRYMGNAALIVFGGPVGIMLGIPSLGLQVGKDASKAMGGNKKRINKTPDTFSGVLLQTTTATFGGDGEKAGAIGDFLESIFTSGALLKPALNPKERAEKIILSINLANSTNLLKQKIDNKNKENDEGEKVNDHEN